MKLSTVQRRMTAWYKKRICVYLTSGPGLGKSTVQMEAPKIIGEQLGLNLGLVALNGPLLNPADAVGYLVPKHMPDGSVRSVFTDPFFWVTEEGKYLTEYDGGIVVVEEADKMDQDVKKVMGEAALSGRLGPHRFPKGWVIWMNGNRAEDRSGSTKELDHLINRRMQLEITPDKDSLLEWMRKNGVSALTQSFTEVHSEIVLNSSVPKVQGPWCTPRSLVKWDGYLQEITPPGGSFPDDGDTLEEMIGMIGGPAAQQYSTHAKLQTTMPKVADIEADPEGVKVPTAADAKMLVSYHLAHSVTEKNVDPLVTYMKRFEKEFATAFIKSACARQPRLILTPAIKAWAKENTSLMLTINAIKL